MSKVMEASPAAPQRPTNLPSRPSVVNNTPLPGWHRSVVLGGALMSPYDASVWHWPPDDRDEPLRSKAEVLAWLASRGLDAESIIPEFTFATDAVLADFPPLDGGPAPLGELSLSAGSEFGKDMVKFRTRDFWVEECSGYAVRRFFDFDTAAGFKHKYYDFLKQFRKSVQKDFVDHVEALYLERKAADEKREQRTREIWACYREPRDPRVFGLRESFLAPECLNLLRQCEGARSAQELLEAGPHLKRAQTSITGDSGAGVESGGGGVYTFRLFSPEFCAALEAEVDHFATVVSKAVSRNSADGRLRLGRPKCSLGDGVLDHGVLLEEMGLSQGFTDVLLARVVRPIARLLFPDFGGASLDNHYAFALRQHPQRRGGAGGPGGEGFSGGYGGSIMHGSMISSGGFSSSSSSSSGGGGGGGGGLMMNEQSGLLLLGNGGSSGSQTHTAGGGAGGGGGDPSLAPTDGPFSLMEDNGEVCLQVCLSGGARGGDLLCYGSREEGGGGRGGGAVRVPLGGAREDLDGQVRSAVGEAVLYRGDELHRWEPLDRDASSRRVLLVVWFRSSSWRADYRFCDDQQPVRDSSYMYF
jgi:hypothetical protein